MSKYHVYIPEVHYIRVVVEADDPPEARLVACASLEDGATDEEYGTVYSRTLETDWIIEKVRNGPGLLSVKTDSGEGDQGSDGGPKADPA